MYRIAIIGAGQLGSRHLQGLALFKSRVEIHVVDPNHLSREVAMERFNAVDERNREIMPQFHVSISELPDSLDIAIVATNADVRRGVIEKLLAHCTLRYLILEKFLFQRSDDYDSVGRLLEMHGVKAWVNCPRREWPFYSALKRKLSGREIYQMHVSGSNWGLGCNAIHLVDLLSYLSGCSEYKLFIDLLDSCTTTSKRAGFMEFTGGLIGRFSKGPFFCISSYANGALPDIIEICGDGFRLIVRESEKIVWTSLEAEQWMWKEESVDLPYQSCLTNLIVERILETGGCDLSSYNESASLHKPLLAGFLAHIKALEPESESEICRIT